MKKRTVISSNCLPYRMPTVTTLVAILAMDFYDVSGWVYGVVGTLLAILWAGWLYNLFAQEEKTLPGYGEQE